jgi:non-reducing end alpha-L-arabinofuranosidase
MKTRRLSNELLLVAILGACSWGCNVKSEGGGGSGGSGGGVCGASGKATFDSTKPPCDIYKEDGCGCVAAHSTVRRLSSDYSGALYQVRVGGSASGTGGTFAEIGVGADGFADGAAQDTACGEEACFISKIYDQSGKGNDLTVAPAGGAKKTPDNEAKAKALPVTLRGHSVYGVHIISGVGYRNNQAQGLAKGDDPETVYMVVDAKYYNMGCCFDYGNMETNSSDNGEGTMEAVYFGNCTIWNRGGGDGPWIMGDLENGLWAGDSPVYDSNASIPGDWKYVTGMVKGDKAGANHWTIKKGNAQSGDLQQAFDGKRPTSKYNPMQKEGAIGLGTGGDNSNADQGNFFEGLMTNHYSSNEADKAVQANIVATYGE